MSRQRWFGYGLVAIFAIRAATVFPIAPEQDIWFMTYGFDPTKLTPDMVEDLKDSLWLGLYAWILISMLGVLAGVLLIRRSPLWPYALLLSSVIYAAVMQPWHWLPFHAEALQSMSRALSRAEWMLGRPSFTFGTLLFPIFVVLTSVYALAVLLRRRQHAV